MIRWYPKSYSCDHSAVPSLLTEYKVNPNSRSRAGQTPLHIAAIYGRSLSWLSWHGGWNWGKRKKYFDKLKGGRSTTTWRTSTEQMLTSWTCPARLPVVAFILLFYRWQPLVNKMTKLPSTLSTILWSSYWNHSSQLIFCPGGRILPSTAARLWRKQSWDSQNMAGKCPNARTKHKNPIYDIIWHGNTWFPHQDLGI